MRRQGAPAFLFHIIRSYSSALDLLDELAEYSPPLDLLAKLTPSAPMRARAVRQAEGSGWFKGKDKADGLRGAGEREKGLVRVLSGEEELANLTTPKVGAHLGLI